VFAGFQPKVAASASTRRPLAEPTRISLGPLVDRSTAGYALVSGRRNTVPQNQIEDFQIDRTVVGGSTAYEA
jgi:hypothetical protein